MRSKCLASSSDCTAPLILEPGSVSPFANGLSKHTADESGLNPRRRMARLFISRWRLMTSGIELSHMHRERYAEKQSGHDRRNSKLSVATRVSTRDTSSKKRE